jgi:hypothetical protein
MKIIDTFNLPIGDLSIHFSGYGIGSININDLMIQELFGNFNFVLSIYQNNLLSLDISADCEITNFTKTLYQDHQYYGWDKATLSWVEA